MLEQLQSLDPAVLTDVVRQDQRCPNFEITEWQVQRLSDRGIVNPDGLFLFRGDGREGNGWPIKTWSVVLKVLTDPGQEVDPPNLWYWKRELLAIQSGLLADLPGPVVAPRCYGALEREGRGWIWMEHVTAKHNGRWTPNDYAFAAEQAGRFNAAYLTGRPLPDYPWLCKDHTRDWLGTVDISSAWESEHVQRAFTTSIRERVMRLSAERERFFAALHHLPQVFSHFDYMRRNLFIRERSDGKDEVVAVDWALCGIDAVGCEMATLIGSSALLCELQPSEWRDVEAVSLDAYLAGLCTGGCEVRPDQVRLGYTAWMALRTGAGIPAVVAGCMQPENQPSIQRAHDCPPDVFVLHEAALCAYSLDLADEARHLMRKLNLA